MNLIERDKLNRQLALDATESYIVQAPAGSGKTELLIQRLLTLLVHVKTPEEILAITFTKKAANEMRSRVIKALKQAMNESEPTSDHAKQTWQLAKRVLERDAENHWELINNPNQLRIQTIDSLCAYLTKQLPLLSHFGSQPDIADNPVTLYREAVQEVLTHIEHEFEWSEAIAKLLLHLDNDLNKLHDLLIHLLAKRDQWLPYIHFTTDDEDIRQQLESHLGYVITDTLIHTKSLFPKEVATELMVIARFAADNLIQSQKSSPIVACRDLTDLPNTTPHDKSAWLGIASLLLTKTHSFRKRFDEDMGFPAIKNLRNEKEKSLHSEFKQRLSILIEKLTENEELRLALSELFFLPEARYQDEQWDILKALLQVLKIVAAQLRLTFQQHGQIDFIENTQAAITALGNDEEATDLALALDYQIRHILVDEFQDTSFTQYQLLEKLTLGWETNDGRTLFVVGDPMQSIYRFREAEVGLFIRMCKNGIGHIRLTPLTLSVNFRSTSPIVNWNNHHFEKIFPAFNDMATGAVTYSKSAAHHEKTDDHATDITIRGFINAEEKSQAKHIIHVIEMAQKNYPQDKIAVLVRSRSHLTTLLPLLKKANIPYRAIEIEPLSSQPIIQDLLALTCALLHPADRIAWLALLRAPWCGLTLADILIIAGDNPYATIWERLENPAVIQQLSADGQLRLKKLFPILKSQLAERERTNLREWVENTWLLIGGPACLNDEIEIENVNDYFHLLTEFTQHHTTLNIDKLKEKINRLFASTHDDHANLQIMTIHTAKGLEFDTVILPHLERKIPIDEKSLLTWMELPLQNDKNALLLAPIHGTGNEKDSLYEYIIRQQRMKSNYEIDRLLYVATTRAKKRLFLFFNSRQKETGELDVETGSFLSKLWPHIDKKHDGLLEISDELEKSATTDEATSKLTKRLAVDWENPISHSISAIAAHKKQQGFQLPNHTPKLIGIVAHRLLQTISELSLSWWDNQSDSDKKKYVEYQLSYSGVLPIDLSSSRELILTIIQRTLNDERGRWILSAHNEAQSELSVTAHIDGKIENIIIDRTFVDEKGYRWIIDYKTTASTDLDQEQEKYFEKMQIYARAMQLMDDRPIRLGLYFPLLPAWREWEGNVTTF